MLNTMVPKGEKNHPNSITTRYSELEEEESSNNTKLSIFFLFFLTKQLLACAGKGTSSRCGSRHGCTAGGRE